MAFPMDVADEGSWQELVKKVVDEAVDWTCWSTMLDKARTGTVLTETRDPLNRTMDMDCWGGQRHALLRTAIIEAGGGTIVNTCSYQGTHFGPELHRLCAMAKARSHGHDARRRHPTSGPYGITRERA